MHTIAVIYSQQNTEKDTAVLVDMPGQHLLFAE